MKPRLLPPSSSPVYPTWKQLTSSAVTLITSVCLLSSCEVKKTHSLPGTPKMVTPGIAPRLSYESQGNIETDDKARFGGEKLDDHPGSVKEVTGSAQKRGETGSL